MVPQWKLNTPGKYDPAREVGKGLYVAGEAKRELQRGCGTEW